MQRQIVSSGRIWEPIIGYSRAVRVDGIIHVAGTTATDDSGYPVAYGDPYAQSVQAIRIIEAALKTVGSGLKDVVRTRIYVTNMDDWKEVARAHNEFFSEIRPASTIVEVTRLIEPELLVEIEVEAINAELMNSDNKATA
ncbi:MAG: RidA family protein [Leptolyngbyaceae cyanobacterium RU_5_1]|nr:RidA family protein [Leptolyngbyaceae cyanobacterium RU_5_1]